MTTTGLMSPAAALPGKGWVRLHRNGEQIYVWAVHARGWQELGWQLDGADIEDSVDADGDGPEVPDGPEAPGPQPQRPELDGPATEASAPSDLGSGGPEGEGPEGAEPEGPDFTAMTKAEIIEHCSRHYGVLLDSGLTKSALVSEARALAAPRLPDALMDDLMT